MFRKTKELQSLVNASRKSLDKAERKIEDYNILLATMEQQAKTQYEEKKQLEKEIANQKSLIIKIKWLLKKQDYGSIDNLKNQIRTILKKEI